MLRRTMIGWTPLVLGLALMLPATTIASNHFHFNTINDVCVKGAAHPNGHNKLVVKVTEDGRSGGQWFTFEAKFQHAEGGGTMNWTAEYTWPKFTSADFPNNSDSHWVQKSYTRDPSHIAWTASRWWSRCGASAS